MQFFNIDGPLDPVIILGTNSDEVDRYREMAEDRGQEVESTEVWMGPIPEHGSFMDISPWTRMSTPEYFFLRKANQLGERDAINVGCELVSLYRSQITAHNMPVNEIDMLHERRTTCGKLRKYLLQVKDTPEGKKALRVLKKVVEEWREYEELMECAYEAQFMFR